MVNDSITIAMISNKCNPSWPCEHPTHMHILGLILPSTEKRFFFPYDFQTFFSKFSETFGNHDKVCLTTIDIHFFQQ